jgi:hypothetical protein
MKRKIKDKNDLKAVYKKNKFLTKPTKGELQTRGYEFESILEFLIAPYELRASYKSNGEQIDGSFFIWGQTFLLEAKWLKDTVPASSLYAFKGKVDGKFHTTSGVYFSMKGYSNDAVNALRYGKSINVLLFTDDDLDYIIEKDVPFETVLKFKFRHAGDSGSPNRDVYTWLKEQIISEVPFKIGIIIGKSGIIDNDIKHQLRETIGFFDISFHRINLSSEEEISTTLDRLNNENCGLIAV